MTPANHPQQESSSQAWACLIGVDAFLAPSCSARPNVILQALVRILRTHRASGFDQSRIRLLPPSAATRREILSALYELGESVPPEDLLLVFSSSPGMLHDHHAFLATADLDPALIPDTGIALERVGQLMQRARARRKILWLDLLPADALSPTPDARDFVQRALAAMPEDIAVIVSHTTQMTENPGVSGLTPTMDAFLSRLQARDKKPITLRTLVNQLSEHVAASQSDAFLDWRIAEDIELFSPQLEKEIVFSSRKLSPLSNVFPNAVQHSDDFFDRTEALTEALDTLRIGARRPIIIQGERGIGKTSLLLHISQRLQMHKIGARRFFRFYIAPGRLDSWEQFVWELLDGVNLALAKIGAPTIDWQTTQPMTFNRLVWMVSRMMESGLSRMSDMGVVVIMDEIDKSAIRPRLLERIIASIHYLIEKTDLPIFFLLTIIAHNLPQPTSGSPMPAKIIRVRPFDAASLDEMVAHLARHEGIDFQHRLLRDWISFYSGGHPYIIKLLLSAISQEIRWTDDNSWRPDAFLQRALKMEEARQLFEDVYRRFFDDAEKTVILALAAQTRGYIPDEEVLHWPAHYQRALLKLVQRGYLVRKEGVRFRIGVWPEWLRNWREFSLERASHPLPALHAMAASVALPAGLCIVRDSQRVYIDGKEVAGMTRRPYLALLYLAEHVGKVVSRDELGKAIYPDEHYMGSNERIDRIISRIRSLLKEERSHYRFLHTVHGRGYRLENATVLPTLTGEKDVR